MPGSTKNLSLCMIAKDESEWIGRALNCVQDLVDEIIVVDTGSTDNTTDIAKAAGASVYHFEWNDDFSAPRNFSLQKAKYDWILVLDADEMLSEEDCLKVHRLMNEKDTCYYLTQRHYVFDATVAGFTPCKGDHSTFELNYPGYFESSLCRLFPNHRGVSYRGRIHELVEESVREQPNLELKHSGLVLHHYGNVRESIRMRAKSELYIDLGMKKAAETGGDWKAWYELGVEAVRLGELELSREALTTAASLKDDFCPTMVSLGQVLGSLGRFDEAIEYLKKAITLKPRHPEAHCNLAVAYLCSGSPIRAEAHFKRAIELKPNYVLALMNYGTLLFRASRTAEAAKLYEAAIRYSPDDPKVLGRFATSLSDVGLADEAREVFLACSEKFPDYAPAFLGLAVFSHVEGQQKKAQEILQSILELKEHGYGVPLSEVKLRAEQLLVEFNDSITSSHQNPS